MNETQPPQKVETQPPKPQNERRRPPAKPSQKQNKIREGGFEYRFVNGTDLFTRAGLGSRKRVKEMVEEVCDGLNNNYLNQGLPAIMEKTARFFNLAACTWIIVHRLLPERTVVAVVSFRKQTRDVLNHEKWNSTVEQAFHKLMEMNKRGEAVEVLEAAETEQVRNSIPSDGFRTVEISVELDVIGLSRCLGKEEKGTVFRKVMQMVRSKCPRATNVLIAPASKYLPNEARYITNYKLLQCYQDRQNAVSSTLLLRPRISFRPATDERFIIFVGTLP